MHKTIDAVALQRKIRDKLGKEYLEDPEKFNKELEKKYGHLQKEAVKKEQK